MQSAQKRVLTMQLALFCACLLILTPLMFGLPNVFDEGFMASGAMMIGKGQLPIRDFFVIYGPGQYYWLAGLYRLFGEDLAVSRLMHAFTLALLGTAMASSTLVLSSGRLRVVAIPAVAFVAMTIFALPIPSYPAVPSALLLLCCALAFDRWFLTGSVRYLLLASATLGCAGLFRWDFGVFGVCALGFAQIVVAWRRNVPSRTRARELAAIVGPWLVLMSLGFGPFVVMGDVQRWVDEVPRFALFEFEKWRGSTFVGPQWLALVAALLNAKRSAAVQAATRLIFAATPFVLVGASLAVIVVRLKGGPERFQRRDALALIICMLVVGTLNQMRIRPSLFQGFPAYAMSLPLSAYLLRGLRERSAASRTVKLAGLTAAVVWLCFIPLYANKDRLRDEFSGGRGLIDLSKASHTRVETPGQLNAYAEMITFIRGHTAANEAIYSGVVDTSRLFANDAMLYFLADRPSATRWIEMEPGLSNTVAAQQEIIRELEGARVRLIALWNLVSNEPNATAYSNGVTALDDYIRAHFVTVKHFGDYEVLMRRPT